MSLCFFVECNAAPIPWTQRWCIGIAFGFEKQWQVKSSLFHNVRLMVSLQNHCHLRPSGYTLCMHAHDQTRSDQVVAISWAFTFATNIKSVFESVTISQSLNISANLYGHTQEPHLQKMRTFFDICKLSEQSSRRNDDWLVEEVMRNTN